MLGAWQPRNIHEFCGTEENLSSGGLVMKRYAVMAIVAGFLVAADDPKDELKKLEGTWTMVSGEMDGKALSADTIKAAKLVIKGDIHDVKVGDDVFKGTHKV